MAVSISILLVLFVALNGLSGEITLGRWLNLLKYAEKAMRRENVTNHTEHFNYNEHVRLTAELIRKYFFNDIFEAAHNESPLRNRHPVDFLIMLDSSSSVGSENFRKAVQVLQGWVEILSAEDFSRDTLRVSMVSFSEPDKVVHQFPFYKSQNKTRILQKIQSTEYHNGRSTSTALGLWLADQIFQKTSREGVTRVLLLATDGWSSDSDLPFGVLWPAARLKIKHGVTIFVLGIGDQVNHNELKAIASRPVEDHLFEVTSYDMIMDVLRCVHENRCLN